MICTQQIKSLTPLKEVGLFQTQHSGWDENGESSSSYLFRSSAVDKHLDSIPGLSTKRWRANCPWRLLLKKMERIVKGRASSQTKKVPEVGQWFLGAVSVLVCL
jgi:hypothetical protein